MLCERNTHISLQWRKINMMIQPVERDKCADLMCDHINIINTSTQFTYRICSSFFLRPFHFAFLGDHWNSGSKCGKIQFNGHIHIHIDIRTRTHNQTNLSRKSDRERASKKEAKIYLFVYFLRIFLCMQIQQCFRSAEKNRWHVKSSIGNGVVKGKNTKRAHQHAQAITMNR